MTRLASTLRWDVRVQWRQGLYYAAIFVVALWSVVLLALPPEGRALILPFGLFMDVSIFGFFFMAGILYLEKGDRVLEALVVTPMPRGWYLASKCLSLTAIAVAASVALTAIVEGVQGINWFYLIGGTALNAWLLTLVGFLIAVRYDAINEFIVPAMVFMIPSQLPLLWLFGIWEGWPLYLLPVQGSMMLIAGAFTGMAAWEVIYSFGYLLLSCVVVTVLAVRAYERFVVEGQGQRRQGRGRG